MSATVETNLETNNPQVNSQDTNEPYVFDEKNIEVVTKAIKNSDTIDQFYEQIGSPSKPKRVSHRQEEAITETGSPFKRPSLSVTRSPQRAYLTRLWDPMQYVNSSDEEECTFKPQINENASKLARRRVNTDTHETLYKDSFARKTKQKEYEEIAATDREKKATTLKTQPKSAKIVLKRLQRAVKSLITNAEEFETKGRLTFEGLGTVLYRLGLFQNLEFIPKGDNGEKSSMSINQAKIKPQRLAKEILFHEGFWKVCRVASEDENTVDSELVSKFVMVLVEEKSSVPDSSYFMQEMMDGKLESMGHQKEENGSVFSKIREEKNLWTFDKIVTEFRRLFDDKTSFMAIYQNANLMSSKKEFQESAYKYSYAPEINKKSMKLDAQYFGKNIKKVIASETDIDNPVWKNRNTRLYNYAKYIRDKKALYLEARIGEELGPCTFSPRVVPYKKPNMTGSLSPGRQSYFTVSNAEISKNRHMALYEVAKEYKEKLQQKAYAWKKTQEIEEMADCTFQPNLHRKYEHSPRRGENFYVNVPRGFKKIVERLHLGEHLRVTRKEEAEKIPRGENYEKNRNAPFDSPTFLTREKIRRKEVLVNVDVSIGHGKTGRIGIHRGDNAKALAKNFARTYSLSEQMRLSLENLLQSYISSYFSGPESNQQEEYQAHYEEQNERGYEGEEYEGVEGEDEEEEEYVVYENN